MATTGAAAADMVTLRGGYMRRGRYPWPRRPAMAQSAHVRHVSTPRFFLLLAVAVVPLLGIGLLAGGQSVGVGLASPSTVPAAVPTAMAGESNGPSIGAQPSPSP